MEVILIPWGLAMLLWGIFILKRSGTASLNIVLLLTACCFGHPFLNFNLGPLPLTLDRLLLVLAAGLYLHSRFRGWLPSQPITKCEIALSLLLTGLLLSLLKGDFKANNFAPAMKFVLFWVIPATVYWLVRRSGASDQQLRHWLGFWMLFTVYLGVTGFAETREWWSVVFPRYIAEPGEFFGRARGPFLNPISAGIFLCAGFAVAALQIPRCGPAARLGVSLVCLAAVAGIYFTYTRMVWLSFVLVATMIGGALLPRKSRLPAAVMSMMLIGIVVATNANRLLEFKRDKNANAEATKDSVHLRPIFAAVAWRMFLDRPFAGCGFGQYSEECVHYLDDRTSPLHLQRARNFVQHNVFLAILCEAGLLALIPFLMVLGCWSIDAWRLLQCSRIPPAAREQGLVFFAVLIPYVGNGMFHDVSICSTVNLLLCYAAGIVANCRTENRTFATNSMTTTAATERTTIVTSCSPGRG